LGPQIEVEWVEELYTGFEDAARQFDFTVAGGDTTKSRGDSMLSIALVGEAMNGARGPVLRSGAQIGDALLVSGSLGDSAAGLALLQTPSTNVSEAASQFLLGRHHQPTPRLALMRTLLGWNAEAIHAALDLSDGLVGDAAHLAKRSNVTLQIEVEQLPISAPCQEASAALDLSALQWALSGGEDYELLLAVAPDQVLQAMIAVEEQCGVPLTLVGYCIAVDEKGARVVVRQNGVEQDVSTAWTHF
jgi:thiamine-monophosphate kinase